MSTSDFEPPSDVLARRRWIKPGHVEWALEADRIIRACGHVNGTGVYEQKWKARNRARRLIDLLVELDLYERWEVKEHTNPVPKSRGTGYQWAVEYVGQGAINGR